MVELLEPEENITPEDEQFWGSLLDKVKKEEKGEQSHLLEVAPVPGFCVKTKDKEGTKVFLNICTTDKIPEPKHISGEDLAKLVNCENEMEMAQYRIPMSIGEAGHAEVDKKGSGVTAYDIAIHPNYLKKCVEENVFLNFFMQVAFEGIGQKFETELLWDWLILKNRKNIGTIKPHMVRTYSKPVIQEISTPAAKTSSQPTHSAPTPEYCVLQEPTDGSPNYLIVEIWLPGIKTCSKITLDVGEDRLIMHAHPAKYFLDIDLPYDVTPSEGGAQFDTDQHLLTVAVPTVK